MKKQQKSKEIGQKAESMNPMDQGLNLVSQVVNNTTGLDEGNDGKLSKTD
ncbi:hypothetical protein ACSVDA_04080 [Cytobacillus sp. Hm23]